MTTKLSKRPVEILSHFQCNHCHMWWSIGDAPTDRDDWYCTWCGEKNMFDKPFLGSQAPILEEFINKINSENNNNEN